MENFSPVVPPDFMNQKIAKQDGQSMISIEYLW
jgi:hypothetical protein